MHVHHPNRSTVRRLVAACAVAVLTACTSSGEITSSSDPTSTTSSDVTTTSVAATTSTTAAPTTTVPVDPRLLRSDGIGASRFGDPATDVVSAISAELGAPTSDESLAYPIDLGGGQFLAADEVTQFIAANGRTVCWSIGFCAAFGGGEPMTLTFTGWTYSRDESRTLHTLSGAETSALWSEVPELVVNPGSGCYSQAYGLVDGVTVSVISSGELFVSWTDDGEELIGDPDPSEVEIYSMEAGKYPFYSGSDC